MAFPLLLGHSFRDFQYTIEVILIGFLLEEKLICCQALTITVVE